MVRWIEALSLLIPVCSRAQKERLLHVANALLNIEEHELSLWRLRVAVALRQCISRQVVGDIGRQVALGPGWWRWWSRRWWGR